MNVLLRISGAIDRLSVFVGQSVYWLILLAVIVSAANATSRKVLSISSNAWLELQWYLFGAAFLLAASYTLQRNEHIRIDIVSKLLPKAARHWIDLFGHVCMLLPLCLVMLWETWPSLLISIDIGERSSNYGGLIVWPAKALIVGGFLLLAVQGASEIIKRVAIMRGMIPDPADGPPAQHLPVE